MIPYHVYIQFSNSQKFFFEMRRKNRWRSVRISYPSGYGCLFSWRLRIWKPFGNILSQKSFGIVWFEVIWRLERAILKVDCKFSTNGFIWSNHHWNFVEWIQEMLSHTYHDPISCLDPIFEFAKKNFQIHIFMHISLRETLKRFLRACFRLRRQNFFVEF